MSSLFPVEPIETMNNAATRKSAATVPKMTTKGLGACGCVSVSVAMLVRKIERTPEARIARRKEVGRADLLQEQPAKDAADSNRRQQIKQTWMEPSLME